jgi:hypothetical protein
MDANLRRGAARSSNLTFPFEAREIRIGVRSFMVWRERESGDFTQNAVFLSNVIPENQTQAARGIDEIARPSG